MTAPVGAVVGLYLDTRLEVTEGTVLQTPSGRSYRVLTVRRQARGKHVGRWHLKVVVIPPEAIDDDDNVIPMRWYSR